MTFQSLINIFHNVSTEASSGELTKEQLFEHLANTILAEEYKYEIFCNSQKGGKRLKSIMDFIGRIEAGQRIMYHSTKFVIMDTKTYLKIVPQGGQHIDKLICDKDVKRR